MSDVTRKLQDVYRLLGDIVTHERQCDSEEQVLTIDERDHARDIEREVGLILDNIADREEEGDVS